MLQPALKRKNISQA